ncbi:putative MFS family arabinose efflux permease [Kribbella voronezhensis]|uniref:Putative MFS family arabinose efflux permease n=1 Tax=Kribbella voronezhensis TaxID=2512212 RepID=A0A4R7TBA9_9ACTN|nr:MFS transporter [Kribbella voronezhensis]TDU89255.1 putative MFS family arabinose efflux permease [Kribbella voronezhensis]
MSLRARLARLSVDLTPWRGSRDFRILLIAGTVFFLGGMVGYVALPFQLYQLTGSNFAVGAMGLVTIAPLVVFGLYGGALADHLDRRKTLIATGIAQAAVCAVMLANSLLSHPQVWVIYACGALNAIATSLQRPSREALLPRVVKHQEMAAAVALSSLTMQVGQLAGPALGGVLVGTAGVSWAFGIELTGVILATSLYVGLGSYKSSEHSKPPSLRGIGEGITYAFRRKDLLATYVVDMVGMFLAMPIVLFPAFATDILKEPKLLGLLYSAEAIGAMAASLTSGWAKRVHHQGRAVVLATIGWGASVGLAGLAPNIWVAIAFFAVAGGADMVSVLFRSVIWNQTIPDEMRGRLAGIEMLGYSLGPLGGQARSGLVADLTGVRTAIVSGGILCVAGVIGTTVWLREFWRYDARTDEHAIRERDLRTAAEAAG